MALIKESLGTLKLYALIFYVGSGFWSLFEIIGNVRGEDFNPVWDPTFILVSLVYIGMGLYFTFKAKELIPHHRAQVVRVITILFLIEIANMIFMLAMILLDPSILYTPEEAGAPDFIFWVIGGSTVGFLFSLLIYLLMVRAVNVVSGYIRPNKKPPVWLTVAMWLIIIGLVVVPFIFLAIVN